MSPELRYRQAVQKARMVLVRNTRLFMADKIGGLPALDERKCLIEQIAAAYAQGVRDADKARPHDHA